MSGCPRCGSLLRVKVSLFLDIDAALVRSINKKTIRSGKVTFDGADWPNALQYCPKAGCFHSERGGV